MSFYVKAVPVWIAVLIVSGCIALPGTVPIWQLASDENRSAAVLLSRPGAMSVESTEWTPIPGLSSPSQAADERATLLRMLRFVPNTPEYTKLVNYGDVAAGYRSWNLPRLEILEREMFLRYLDKPRNKLILNLSTQAWAPALFDLIYAHTGQLRSAYGFDFYTIDRFIEAGGRLHPVVLVEFDLPVEPLRQSLAELGYQPATIGADEVLFSILKDYEVDFDKPAVTPGVLDKLNRIAIREGQLIAGPTTELVERFRAARDGRVPSAADNATIQAAVAALTDSSQIELGDLIGIIFSDDPAIQQWVRYGKVAQRTKADIRSIVADLKAAPLPPFQLVAFSTRHGDGASYLSLALVYPDRHDADLAVDALIMRLSNFVSLITGNPRWLGYLYDYWASDVNGFSVAVITLLVPDPTNFESVTSVLIPAWGPMIDIDLLYFLTTDVKD